MIEARPGICIRCDARGSAGQPCENRTCKKGKVHLLPDEYANRANDSGYVVEPMIGRVIDDWLVVDVLGRGGFGVVYSVLQLPIFLKAALKLLHRDPPTPDETPAQALARRSAQAKFAGEAQALAALTHPGVVRLLKFGHFESAPYLVMEFAPGRPLSELMEHDPRTADIYRLEVAHQVLRQLTNALEAAHMQLIVHRDIKPANIILQALPGDPYFVRVLDFGIAKFLHDGSKTSLSAGTPIYMAPEQFDRKKIGPWSDLYAVGVMTFELMFGQPPFGASTVERVLAKKLAPDADPLVEIRGQVPEAVERYFARSLARRPEDRYASAAELRVGLDEAFAAARTVPRETLLSLVHMREDERSYAETDFQKGGPADATELDLRRRGEKRSPWPWAFALGGIAAAATGIAILSASGSEPKAIEPATPATTVTLPTAADPDGGLTTNASTQPLEPDTFVAVTPDTNPDPDALLAVAPETVEPPDTATPDMATPDTALPDTTAELEDATSPEPDTRKATTRPRPDVSAATTIVDTYVPEPPRDTSGGAPQTPETRPYRFLD